MSKKPNVQAFLTALNAATPDSASPPGQMGLPSPKRIEPVADPTSQVHLPQNGGPAPTSDKPSSRAQLTHFGGYLDDETFEKIVLLRVRLKMDNSKLIKFAIDELYRKHSAKRAFGDI